MEDVVTVSADDDLQLVVDLLGDEERDDNRLPVLDGDRLMGIFTRQDLPRNPRRGGRGRRPRIGIVTRGCREFAA